MLLLLSRYTLYVLSNSLRLYCPPPPIPQLARSFTWEEVFVWAIINDMTQLSGDPDIRFTRCILSNFLHIQSLAVLILARVIHVPVSSMILNIHVVHSDKTGVRPYGYGHPSHLRLPDLPDLRP